jgi:hypothetical protein
MRSMMRDDGQALAEFGVALLVLVPLLFWILRFADMLTEKHRVIEMSRFAVWEMANGGDASDVEARVQSTLAEASMFSTRSDVSIDVDIGIQSTRTGVVALAVGINGEDTEDYPVSDGLDLNYNNLYTCRIALRHPFLLGLPTAVSDRSALVSDTWYLTDRTGNGEIKDEDLEKAVYGLYFWPDLSGAIATVLDVSHTIQDSWVCDAIEFLMNIDLDIEPWGHPKLENVPQPGGARTNP